MEKHQQKNTGPVIDFPKEDTIYLISKTKQLCCSLFKNQTNLKMKNLALLILVFFFLKGAHSQSYYYYQGSRIDLEQRTDKMAIVLNSSLLTKEYLLNSMSDLVGNSGDVKEASQNVYLVNFKETKSQGEIDNLILNLSSRDAKIKFSTPVYFGESQRVTQIPTDEFVVRLRNVSDKEKLDVINAENNVSLIGNVGDERGFLLKSNNDVRANALVLSNIYYRSGLFEFAEPNFMYPEYCLLNSTPNDANYPQQWALNNTGQSVPTGNNSDGDASTVTGIPNADMNVDLAWDFTLGSASVQVGVIDTGIDSTHPDFALAGHLLAGYDGYYNKYGVPRDSNSHGTCTAGLIGAVRNNSIGTAGIAAGCQLMSLRIFNGAGSATNTAIGRAFDTARVKGIDVISNSWGGGTPSATITNPINTAATSGRGGLGCIILFSTGNDGHNPPSYPSYLANVVAVGSSTTHDQKKAPANGNQFWWGGNYGSSASGDIDIVAPTVCYTTDVQSSGGYNTALGVSGNYMNSFNGTSCSCPNAAGVAALTLSVSTGQTGAQVIDKLIRGCEKIDNVSYSTSKTYGKWNEYFGYGRINALNSVRLAAGVDVVPPTINHLNISSLTTTYPVSISAEILDQDGAAVPTSGNNQPKLFYRLNKNNAGYGSFDSLTAVSVAGNNFTFKVPCVGHETQVQYYIRGRDNSGNSVTFPRGAPNAFWLCYYAVGTFNQATGKINGFVAATAGPSYSPTVAFGSFNIVSTRVRMWVKHTNIGSIVAALYSPLADGNNNRKALFSANPYPTVAANITGATVADSATLFWNGASAPWTDGLFKGDYILKGYNGQNANGNWRILNYDFVVGGGATWDSARITFTKTTGTTSSSARLNSAGDSVLNFGTVNYGDIVNRNFYLKNVGNANLTVSSATFSGTEASKFSLLTSLPGPIVPGDSGLFTVRLTSTALDNQKVSASLDAFQNALLNINNNDPSKPVFKVSLESDNILPSASELKLKVFIEGFYNTATNVMIGDTMRAYIRNNFAPYSIVDSGKAFFNSTGNATMTFTHVSNAVNYYIQLKHRNALETWSKSAGQSFAGDSLNYDFTTDSSQAYGNNQTQVETGPNRFAVYEGDVDHNGVIGLTDITAIQNDASLFLGGYRDTDVNGDNLVNLNDLLITSNNSSSFVVLLRP